MPNPIKLLRSAARILVTALTLLTLLPLSASASASPTAALASQCPPATLGTPRAFSLSDALACAPGAVLLQRGAKITADGTYIEPASATSYVLLSFNSVNSAGSASQNRTPRFAAGVASASNCGSWHSISVWWVAGVSNTLYSQFCFNWSTAVAYNTYGTCAPWPVLGASCAGINTWDSGSWTPDAWAQGRFHSSYYGLPGCEYLYIGENFGGNWWADWNYC